MRSNASIFRTFNRIEEQMMRAAMPRISAQDPKQQPVQRAVVVPAALQLQPLTYRMQEVARG